MRSLIQLAVAIVLLSITTLYANANRYEYKYKIDKEKYKLIDNLSVSSVIKNEIARIEQRKASEELEEHRETERERERIKHLVSRGSDRGTFIATAYDLSITSCGKKESHPAYGITANGTSLKGHTLESARAIAVDPKVIKLGSKVYIEFLDEEYQHLDGEYVAVDTGSAIKGNKIDIFFGDTGDSKTDQAVWDFGRRKAKVTILLNSDK